MTNTGRRAGAEVAQLYLAFPAAAGEPVLQLRGFEKVFLAPGAAAAVAFPLGPRALSVWDPASHRWAEVRGEFGAAVGASVADAATALAAGGATMASYLLSEEDKNSLWSNFVFMNAQAVAGAIMATAGLLVFLGLMGLLPTSVNQPSLLMCLLLPFIMCWVASMRWAEDEYRIGIRIQLPTSLLLTAGAFVLFKGDLGNWTMPITTLIQPIAVSTKFLIGYGQGNMLKYAVGNLPFWIVFMLAAMVPAYGVVAPALLLAHDPNLYAAYVQASLPPCPRHPPLTPRSARSQVVRRRLPHARVRRAEIDALLRDLDFP